ncbi:TNFAIP3-interacting protein 3 [Sigmodon hispidus]
MAGLNAAGAAMEHEECAPSRRKDLTNSLEQKIKRLEKQRQELLEVNQQWYQQFRNMKELYERKVLELKTKLEATEDMYTLEKKQKQSMTEGDRQLEEIGSLREELQTLRKENKLLKENHALSHRKKEHYVCEIKRLNKALQDALTIRSSSLPEGSRKCKGRCSHAEMREKGETHKQQICLPACNCGLVSHLENPWVPKNQGPIQHLWDHATDHQWNALNQFPPHVQHKAHGFSSERVFNQ